MEPETQIEPEVTVEAPMPIGDVAPEGVEASPPETVSDEHLRLILESLVFVAEQPVPARVLARAARTLTANVRRLMPSIIDAYQGRGIELVEVAGGYQFRSVPQNAPFVREFVAQRPVRLTRAQLETLAILAYRQPVTRPEIDEIRGVDTGSSLKVLLDRGLVKILGRKDEPGRPLLYGTAPYFLEFFGLGSLNDLPTLKEFTELSDDSRALFARKTGEEIDLGSINAEVAGIVAERDVNDPEFDDPNEIDAAPADPEAETVNEAVADSAPENDNERTTDEIENDEARADGGDDDEGHSDDDEDLEDEDDDDDDDDDDLEDDEDDEDDEDEPEPEL